MQYDNLSVDQKAQIGERFPDYATPNKNHELVDYVKVDRNMGMSFLTRSRRVNLWAEMVKNSYPKIMRNI